MTSETYPFPRNIFRDWSKQCKSGQITSLWQFGQTLDTELASFHSAYPFFLETVTSLAKCMF